MQILKNPNYNFIRWRWHALALSWIIILAGVAVMWTKGIPLGIDFKGGTLIILKFDRPVAEDQVRTALDRLPGDKVVQKYGPAAANEILVRLPQSIQQEEGTLLEQDVQAAEDAIKQANLGNFERINTEVVGPIVGAQLQRKGVLATLFSLLGITVYIAFRFRPSFALGAVIATLHDIFVMLAFLTFFNYELSLNVVAAILSFTGYSVNDTIVIFDRVRENFRTMRRDALEQVVNTGVNQTLGRTIITSGTTLLAVLSLFLFGGEVLKGFAFTMLVGVITGTYSSVFIAAPIAIMLSRKREKARAPVASSQAAANGNASSKKKGPRKSRAS